MTSVHRLTIALLVLAASTSGAHAQAAPADDPWRRAPSGESSLRLPAIDTIHVTPDTVWFCDSHTDRSTPGYYFARRSSEWKRIDRSSVAACPPRSRTASADTIRGIDYTITRQDSTEYDNLQRRARFPFLRLVDHRYRKTTTLLPDLSPSFVRSYAERYGPVGASNFASISTVSVTDTLLWIGLTGDAAQGAGSVGGLFKVHRPTGRFTLFLNPQLEASTVSSMVTVGRWMWIGTTRLHESLRLSLAGLVRYDAPSGNWHSYDPNKSPLPDRFIQAIATDGQILAVATRTSVAVARLPEDITTPIARPSRDEVLIGWEVQGFEPAFENDSLVFDLVPQQASTLAAAEPRIAFAVEMAPKGRERPLAVALSRVPVESLSVWRRNAPNYEPLGTMIADRSLVPTLLATRPWSTPALFLASGVIGALGANAPERARAALLREFTALDDSATSASTRDLHRGVLGRALTRVGDSTAIRWARGTLKQASIDRAGGAFTNVVPSRHGEQLAAAASIVAAGRDRVGLGLLISAVPVADRREQVAFATALASYDDLDAWRSLVAFGKARFLPPGMVLHAMTPAKMRDSSIATVVMQLIHDALRDDVRNANLRGAVLTAAVNLRLCALGPALVEMLYTLPPAYGDMVAAQTIRTLVNLYGESAAPVYAGLSPSLEAVQWWKQRTARSDASTCVSAEAGRAAETKWNSRQADWQKLR